MPVNQITIPQQGTANYAPGADGTPAAYQPSSTLVPDPGKADGTGLGTGSNTRIISSVPDPAYVPNPAKADGIGLGTGTGVTFLASSTQVPSPQKADGTGLGTGSNVSFVPSNSNQRITYVPNPTQADGTDGGSVSTGPAPSAPTSANIQDLSSNSNTTVTWTNGATLGTTNQVFRSTDGTNYSLRGTVAGSATQFTDTGTLADGNMWFYKVCAVFNGASSAFSNIVSVCQNFTSPNVGSISFPTLIIAYGNFNATSLAALTSVSMPLLRNVSSTLNLSGNSSLASLNLNSLVTVGNSFFLGDSQPVILSFPALLTVGASGNAGDFQVHGNTQCTTLSCPNLQTVSNNLTMYGMTALTSVSFPLLTGVGEDGLLGRLDFNGNNKLTTISFPSLTGVWTEIDFSACTLLTSVQFASLVDVGNGGDIFAISASTCPAMTTWNAPNLTSIANIGLSIDFTGNALTAASINQILHACALSNLGAGTNVNLNGGTNAAPTGQGVTDKNTLIANGATVATN